MGMGIWQVGVFYFPESMNITLFYSKRIRIPKFEGLDMKQIYNSSIVDIKMISNSSLLWKTTCRICADGI